MMHFYYELLSKAFILQIIKEITFSFLFIVETKPKSLTYLHHGNIVSNESWIWIRFEPNQKHCV